VTGKRPSIAVGNIWERKFSEGSALNIGLKKDAEGGSEEKKKRAVNCQLRTWRKPAPVRKNWPKERKQIQLKEMEEQVSTGKELGEKGENKRYTKGGQDALQRTEGKVL